MKARISLTGEGGSLWSPVYGVTIRYEVGGDTKELSLQSEGRKTTLSGASREQAQEVLTQLLNDAEVEP